MGEVWAQKSKKNSKKKYRLGAIIENGFFWEKTLNLLYLLNEGSNQKNLENRPLLEFDFTPINTPHLPL